jgi:hypothetical protein
MQYFMAVYVPMASTGYGNDRFTFVIETSLVSPTGSAVVGNMPPVLPPTRDISPKVAEYDTLVLSSEPIAMVLNFNTSFDTAIAYKAYYVHSPLRPASNFASPPNHDLPCAMRDDSVDVSGTLQMGTDPIFADPSRCVFSSPCAVASNMIAGSEWLTLPPGTAASIRIEGLQQNVMYTFTVVALNPKDGQMAVYNANRGIPVYSKSTTIADSSTIGIVAGSAVGGFSLLIIVALALKWHIDKRVDAGDKRYTSLATKAARRMSQLSEARRASLVAVVPQHIGSSTGVLSSVRTPQNLRNRTNAGRKFDEVAPVDDQMNWRTSTLPPAEAAVSTSTFLRGMKTFKPASTNKLPLTPSPRDGASTSPASPTMSRTLSRNGSFMSPSANPIAGRLTKGVAAAGRGDPNDARVSTKVNLNALRKDTRPGVARNPFSPAAHEDPVVVLADDNLDISLA